MRIKVPFEVAIVIIVAVAIFLAVLWFGWLATWLEKRFSKGRIRTGVRVLGIVFAAAGIPIAGTFYLEQYQRHEIYRGLYKFDLGDVVLATVLFGAAVLCWFWARWRLLAVLWAVFIGAALVLKPFIWPLISTWGGEHTPYGITSETHLYFLLSGLGIAALGVILAFRARSLRAQEAIAVSRR